MKTMDKRLTKLEDQLRPVGWKPKGHLRMVFARAGATLSLDGGTCKRTLCPDGTLMELVLLLNAAEGLQDVSEQEMDEWVAGFPIVSL